MLTSENKDIMMKDLFSDLQGQEELISQILLKFDLLLDKEEYYNYQERVYKLNKAFSSISRAKNLSVSNFTESSEKNSEGNACPLVKLDISLETLARILDDLIKEKDSHTEGDCLSLLTSSSEEEARIKVPNLTINTLSNKRKKLFRNLYNYELLLKTYFYEKTLNTSKEKQMLEELAGNVTASNFSTNNQSSSLNVNLVNETICGTPLTKTSNCGDLSAKTLNFTPSIKKSFFEDKDFKKCIDKRRRSMIEELKVNLGSKECGKYKGSPNKRKSAIMQAEKYSYSYSNNKRKSQLNSKSNSSSGRNANSGDMEDGEISQFNFPVNSKAPAIPNLMDSRRTSIFREKEYFLTNILENEEYCSNITIENSIDSDNSDIEIEKRDD